MLNLDDVNKFQMSVVYMSRWIETPTFTTQRTVLIVSSENDKAAAEIKSSHNPLRYQLTEVLGEVSAHAAVGCKHRRGQRSQTQP